MANKWLCKIFLVVWGGEGMVNKVHHDECENGDKHYIKHYIEAFC